MNSPGNTASSLHSVEFCHIYTDEPFSDTQISSINHLKKASSSWNLPYATVLLFDNYNIEKSEIPTDDFFHQLEGYGAIPDFWAFEKELTIYAEEFLSLIEVAKIKRQYKNYIQSKNIYPCSFLTSIWYFLRLGYIEDSHKIIRSTNNQPFYPSQKLINILAEDFTEVEKTALKLIKSTAFKEAAEQIDNLFYKNSRHSMHNNKLLL